MRIDPFAVLELDWSTCTVRDVQAAFRAKAKRLHPDAGGDEESYKTLSCAYAMIGAEDKLARVRQAIRQHLARQQPVMIIRWSTTTNGAVSTTTSNMSWRAW